MTTSSTNSPFKFMISDESVTVYHEGRPWVVKKGSPHFINLKNALHEERWADVPGHLTVTKSIETWSNDKFEIKGNNVKYMGEEVPEDITARIVAMATNGENPTILFNFWERLSKNPSYRSVQQLYGFLKHSNIPLTPEGKILTYKSVRQDYKDVHSGKFDNRPGVTNKMLRNKISDDQMVACDEGFHVGAMGYVRSFHSGGRIVVCEVDPEHVVSVPQDSSAQKMRVCEYKVIGNYGTELPSTSISIRDLEYSKHTTTATPEVHAAEPDDDEEIKEDEWDGDKDDPDDDDDSEDTKPDIDEDDDGDDEDEDGPLSTAAVKTTAKKAEEKKKSVVKKKPNKGYAKLNKLDMAGLTKQSLDDLRKYATYGLEIIGASKIPGGKTALISRILEVREDD